MQTQTVQPLVQNSLNCHNVVKLARNQKYQRHLKQIVSCHVANRAPIRTLEGHPQKKGIRPDV